MSACANIEIIEWCTALLDIATHIPCFGSTKHAKNALPKPWCFLKSLSQNQMKEYLGQQKKYILVCNSTNWKKYSKLNSELLSDFKITSTTKR